MSIASVSRRTTLKLLGSVATLAFSATAPSVRAEDATGINFIVMADLHSAYDRMGQLLAAVETQVGESPVPSIIIINGDLFESGNVVTARSAGEIDWAFLKELSQTAPVVFNIGNHEADIDNDLASFVSAAQALGVTVLTNITDSRTGKLYAPASATLEIDGQPVTFAAIGVNNLFTYPKATREQLTIPEPVAWARDNLDDQLTEGHINVVLSHAGVVPDKAILEMLPDGTLMIGGHDHLDIEHSEGDSRYLHTGCWSTACTVVTVPGPGEAATFRRIEIDPAAKPSDRLADLIPSVMAKHLTEDDRAIVAKARQARSSDQTGLFVAAALAEAAGGDVGFVGHTTFGAGLPGGDISHYDFNSSVRFDGTLKQTEVSAEVLQNILKRCNQFGDFAFAERTGDYLYASPDATAKKSYVLVCNDWSAMNAKNYFGRDDLTFSDVPELKVKSVALAALDSTQQAH